MALPGFTAEQSIRPALVNYTHGAAFAEGTGRGYVSPQFLDWVKEAFESVGSALSSAAQTAASAISSAISKLNSAGQGAGQSFSCSNFVSQMLVCNGNSPVMAAAQMAQQCLSRTAEIPEAAAICPALAASVYELAQQYCQNPNQNITPYLQAACPNG
jgi:prephenate dehydratase